MQLFMSGLGMQELIILVPLFFIFALWIGAIVDIVRSNFTDSNQKIVWILIVIFVPFIGPILYFALGRTGRIKA